jgi:hypothetical protein
MDHSGVIVPDELASCEWERCPDWDGRPVIRRSHHQTRWILWQGPNGLLDDASCRQSISDQKWHRVLLDDVLQSPLAVDFFLDSNSKHQSPQVWFRLELQSIQSVDLLIDRFGRPPQEVQRDWLTQQESSSSNHSVSRLSHLLVLPDGQLLPLASVEQLVAPSLSNKADIPEPDHGPAVPDEKHLRNASMAGETANRSLHELLKIALPTSVPTHPTLGVLHRKVRPSIPPRLNRNLSIYASTAIGLLVVLGIWMSRPSQRVRKELAQVDTNSSPMTAVKPEEDTAFNSESLPPESPVTLELTSDLQSSQEITLGSQASSSLESLIGQIAGGKPPVSIDSISFESVTEALNQTSDESIIQESLTAAGSENHFNLSKATQPFAVPLDDVAAQDSMEQAKASTDSTLEKIPENTTATGFVTESFSVRQAQFKSMIRVPFKPNDRQAVCRVKLKTVDPLLMKPEEAIELVGRQDTGWTVALNDDSVQLKIYLRSIPARSWNIATAVRLKWGTDSEIPIGKNDATQVCLRLQNYLRWLDQSRQVGESMRSNRKTRSMAMAGLEQIEKQTKSTEKSLKHWMAIEKLVLAFYQENSIELELASSMEMLPKP